MHLLVLFTRNPLRCTVIRSYNIWGSKGVLPPILNLHSRCSYAPAALLPRKALPAVTRQVAGWDPQPVCTCRTRAPAVNRATIPRSSGRSLVTTLTTVTRLGLQKVNQAECVLYTKEGAEEVKWALKPHRRVV